MNSHEPTYTSREVESTRERAQILGLNTPTEISILPRGFFSTSDFSKLVFEASTPTIKALLRQEGIQLENIVPTGLRIPLQAQHDATWIGPVLFFGTAVLSANPNLVNIALGVIANYVTEFFKGKPGKNEMHLSVVVEQTEKKKTIQINYDGPIDGLEKYQKMIRDATK